MADYAQLSGKVHAPVSVGQGMADAMKGTVQFVPFFDAVVANDALVLPGRVTCDVDVEGNLSWNGQAGVQLLAPAPEDPYQWTWRVVPDVWYGKKRVYKEPYDVKLVAGQSAKLHELTPVPGPESITPDGVLSKLTKRVDDFIGQMTPKLIAENTDFDNLRGYTSTGMHYVSTRQIAATLVNYPTTERSNVFVISGPPSYSYTTQIVYEWGVTKPKAFKRTMSSATTWTAWEPLGSGTSTPAVPAVKANTFPPEGLDVDLMRGPDWAGAWDIIGAADAAKVSGTLPEGMTSWLPGNLLVLGHSPSTTMLSSQLYAPYQRDKGLWYRNIVAYQSTGAAAWAPWVNLAAKATTPPPAPTFPTNSLALGSRAMRVQLFEEAYPLVSTGNKGAVVLRFDHGLTNFKAVILPLLQKYNLPAYIAMNPRNWGIAENSGATLDEAKAWPNVEWGNHTSDHADRTGIADIFDTVVNSRIELEEQLGRTIHGFTVPGLTEYNKLDGFGTGGAGSYSNSYGGALILSHHAVCSGTITAPGAPAAGQRILDGVNRIGGRHSTWESGSWATIKGLIDSAADNKTALTLMCHPRTMNLNGYWTPELADQVLGYIRQLIDEGKLANISYYQSHRAQLAPLTAAVAPATSLGGAGRPDVAASMTTAVQAAVAAASDGAVFTSTDGGGNGAWQWQKRAGTWKVLVGDTGEKVIGTPSNVSIMTSGRVIARRVGDMVTVTVDNAEFSGTGVPGVPLAAGYQASTGRTYAPLLQGNTSRGSLDQGFSTSNVILRVSAAAANVGGSITFPTSQSWPTS